MKRLSIILFFLLVAAGVWGWFQLTAPAKPLALAEPLRINQGLVLGGIDPGNSDIRVYNGIPYASARRWSVPGAPPNGARCHVMCGPMARNVFRPGKA
jgi:para-nitrobenzyl esterase